MTGQAHLIGPHHLKEGAVVVDVGINWLMSGKLVGDVDFAAVAHKVITSHQFLVELAS